MKNLYRLKNILIITGMLFFFSVSTYANWIKAEQKIQDTPNLADGKAGTPQSKSDSLPAGVTKDWLNNLRDENGNPVIPEDPEGDALQRSIFTGAAADDQYGYSVSSAGDVNGDGFDDVIIGAPNNDAAGSDAGRAYIYYGGLNMNTISDVILTGEVAYTYFGGSVAGAGDVNGDGYSDVIVGTDVLGRAQIFYGGVAMNSVADVTMSGEAASIFFGNSVSGAGDLNNDGYSDVIVGAYGYSSYTGRAYVYYGGAVMNNVADVTMTGEAVNNGFGRSVSAAGDVNGDGYPDVILGANEYSSSTGRAYIYYGGAAMNNVADVTMTGEAPNNGFGFSVSEAGDVNNDGYADVNVGAYGYSSSTGRAYIYYGGAVMNNVADVTLTGEAPNNGFGFSVSGVGDINGDGYSDVVVGALGYSSYTGKAYIYFGSAIMNNTADLTISGEAPNNRFGVSVSGAGDVNGDGYADVIVGAIYGFSSYGSAYVYTNTITGEDIPDIIATGSAGSLFGNSVSSAGDVNGDG
ncbi:MAG: FG-GAP-like repeat-containing protein, partial [Ignavibacteria bacterium]